MFGVQQNFRFESDQRIRDLEGRVRAEALAAARFVVAQITTLLEIVKHEGSVGVLEEATQVLSRDGRAAEAKPRQQQSGHYMSHRQKFHFNFTTLL